MDTLPPLAPVTRLSPRIIRILGDNPSKFTLQGSNTYLLGTGPRRLLLDTGEGRPAWRTRLEATLKQENATIDTVLLTHWHGDHVGGVSDVRALAPEAKVYKHLAEQSAGQGEIADGQVFSVHGVGVRAVFSPGHTADHMAFVVVEGNDGEGEGDEGAVFTGDNVLGHGTAVFEDLASYVQSLERIKGVYGSEEEEKSGSEQRRKKKRAYPGHGEVIEDGRAKVVEYIAHRRQREAEIVGVMQGETASGKAGWSSMEIVKIVYKNYPENLHIPAEGGVKQVLAKLESEGRILKDGERWSLTDKTRAAL